MISDEISSVVKKDELIATYGSFQLSTNGFRKANNIRQRMRILARLLIALNESLNLTEELKFYFKPQYFDNVVDVAKQLGGFSMITNHGEHVACFKIPSLPLKIGYTVEKCASLLKAVGIKSGDKELEKNAVRFQELYCLEWSVKISSIGLKTLSDNKFEKVQLLPVTEDLLKVRSYMKSQIPQITNQLTSKPTVELWRSLAEVLGARLTIFNRRRGNEVYKLLLSRYKEKHKWKEGEMPEIKDSLTPLEKRLMRR